MTILAKHMKSYQYSVRVLLIIAILIWNVAAAKRTKHRKNHHILLVKENRGIRNVALAKRSMSFPLIIPLLFGNMIIGHEKKNENSYELYIDKAKNFTIMPLNKKGLRPNMGGFVITRSTQHFSPVSIEGSAVFVQLTPVSKNYGKIKLWIMSKKGHIRKKERRRKELFLKSLVQDFADNCQRNLGVKDCGNMPTVSGLCNNRRYPQSGSTFYELRSTVKRNRPTTSDLTQMSPGPRYLSNRIFVRREKRNAPKNINVLMVFFGQFIDHEIVQTPSEKADENAQAPVQNEAGLANMSFTRSAILRHEYTKCCNSGYESKNVHEGLPFNTITSFIDGSAIYGSDNLRANTLRQFKGGRMVQKGPKNSLLPMNHLTHIQFKLENEPSADDSSLFVAGDIRANENTILLAIHTVFVREHNRVVKLLKRWLRKKRKTKFLSDDEWLFKAAKKIVIAELQVITFEEFVPAMLGDKSLPKYKGYKPNVDSRISTFHSSFAYRWGHSSVPESIQLKDSKGKLHNRSLRDMFFNTQMFLQHGVDNLLKGAMNTVAEDADEQIVDSVRDFLFNPRRRGVLDLGALNIQRTRDLGVPSYLELQKIYKTGSGLENIKPGIRNLLLQIYGRAENIDAFVGGLCEKKVKGSLLGPLFHVINIEQFSRLRDGDRFYYRKMRWPKVISDMPLIRKIKKRDVRFQDIVLENTGISRKDIGLRRSMFRTQ